MATSFLRVTNNALSITGTNLSSPGVTQIDLAAGTGAKFPASGSFRLDLWNGDASEDPTTDPHYEQVIASARSGDTVTISPTTKTHTSNCNVMLPNDAGDITDLQTAVNALENSLSYEQSFTNASSVTVTHNLGRYPAVTVLDSAGDECEGAVDHLSLNQLSITFSASFSGVVVCN